MIKMVTAVQFDRLAGSGRTGPAFLTCERASNDVIEVVAKLSARCDLRETSLALELIGAFIAGDLGLPVPEPFLVQLEADWIDTIVDAGWAAAARRSCDVAFGSKRVPTGFNTWIVGSSLSDDMLQVAAGTFLFDAIAENPDRRDANPNCLIRGRALRLIDHEMCFSPVPVIGWQPPWRLGALRHLEKAGAHIFRAGLRRQSIDWAPIRNAWEGLSDSRLDEYAVMLPASWATAKPAVEAALRKVQKARDNIDACITEAQRVLT